MLVVDGRLWRSPECAPPAPGRDLARPPSGPLAWVLGSDARPARARVAGQARCAVHAKSGFSRRHLEQPTACAQQQVQDALDKWRARRVEWRHCMAHRWRYALPQSHAQPDALAYPFWRNADQILGACGDFLGGIGVEGAWLSGQALSAALLRSAPDAAHASEAIAPQARIPLHVA